MTTRLALRCSLLLLLAGQWGCSQEPGEPGRGGSPGTAARTVGGASAPEAEAEAEAEAKSEEEEEEGDSGSLEAGVDGADAAPQPPNKPFDIDRFVDSLTAETVVFNVPESVLIDESVQVRLLMHPGEQASDLLALFEAQRTPAQVGEASTPQVPTSPEMGATLRASGLDITALRQERQFLSAREPTEWLWDVRATEPGEHALTLDLYAIPTGSSSSRSVKVYERSIEVVVPRGRQISSFAMDNWEWLWTFLFAPAGGWWFHRRGKRLKGAED